MERLRGKLFIDEIAAQKGVPREEVLEEMATRLRIVQAKVKELVVNNDGKFRVVGELGVERWIAGEFGTKEEASEFAIWGSFYPDLPAGAKVDIDSAAKALIRTKNQDELGIMYHAYTPDGKLIPWLSEEEV